MSDDEFNPNEPDLYKLLGVAHDAPHAEIKKAYYKLAVKLHPDKNPGDETAKERFQALQRVYAVLGDDEKRKVYDQTGSLQDSEELTSQSFKDLYDYYREMFPKVTQDDIEAFEASYRGSGEEARDLLELYQRFEGDMAAVFDWLMCSRPDIDAHRFMEKIDAAIEGGDAKRHKAYTAWAKDTAKRPKPKTDPLAPPPPKKGKGGSKGKGGAADDSAALVAAIRARQGAGASFLDALAEKYGGGGGKENSGKGKKGKAAASGGGGKKGKGAAQEGPSEEEFAAAAARLEARKAAGAAGHGGSGKAPAAKRAKKA